MRFKAGVQEEPKPVEPYRFKRGVTRESIARARTTAGTEEQRQQQLQLIPGAISEREARIKQLEEALRYTYSTRVKKVGIHYLDKREAAKARAELAQLRGEIQYLQAAQTAVEGGSIVEGDITSQASQYAQSTSAYQQAKYSEQKVKARARAKAKTREAIQEEYGVGFVEAQRIRDVGLPPITITTTDLPPEQVTGGQPTTPKTSPEILTPLGDINKLTAINQALIKRGIGAAKKGWEFLNPFSPSGESNYVAVGGTLVPREQYEVLTPSQQRAAQILQPENILLMTQFPRIRTEPVEVKFAGVKTAAKGEGQVTGLKFTTSEGQSGSALGVSKTTGQSGRVYAGQTQVVGLKEGTKFAVDEGILGIKDQEQFVQTAVGKISSAGKVSPFRAVDLGRELDKATISGGITEVNRGVGGYAISKGIIFNLDQATLGGGTIIGTGGGTGTTTLSQSFQQASAAVATQQAVRAAAQTPVTYAAPIGSLAVGLQTTATALNQILQTSPAQIQTPEQTTRTIGDTTTTTIQQTIPEVITRTTTATIPAQTTIPVIRTIPLTQGMTITQTIPTLPITPTPTPPIIPLGFYKPGVSRRKIGLGGFDVAIKRGGKFRTIATGLPFGKAISVGSQRVKSTLAATFKLIPRKGAKIEGGKLPKGIRQKKGKVLTYEEERRYRLDMPGELKEIKLSRRKF